MIYKIIEISTHKDSGHTFFRVHYWRDSSWRERSATTADRYPHRINDFLMQLRSTGPSIVRDSEGRVKLSDGSFVAESEVNWAEAKKEDFEWGTVTFDLPPLIKKYIEAYWKRAEERKYPADHSDNRIKRDNSDPHGVLAREDVQTLKEQLSSLVYT